MTNNHQLSTWTRADSLTSDLCAEIDQLEAKVKYWKEREKYWREEYAKLIDSDIKHGQEMMKGMLMLALKGPEILSKKEGA